MTHKHLTYLGFLIVCLLGVGVAAGMPFSIETVGTLEKTTTLPLHDMDLDGATIRITFYGDTTQGPRASGGNPTTRAYSHFDLAMRLQITDRPAGGDPINVFTDENVTLSAYNTYPGGSPTNDLFWITAGQAYLNPPSLRLSVRTLSYEADSQQYFTGTDPVWDLSFLSPPGPGLVPTWANDLTLYARPTDASGGSDTYRMADMTVAYNLVPLPGAALLGSLGLGVAGWRLKRRTSRSDLD